MTKEFEEREQKLKFLLAWQKENNIPFIVNLTKDIDPFVRAEAYLVLGGNANSELYSHIIKGLNDDDHHVRYCAAEALGRLGSRYGVEYLANTARENSEFVRCKAINAMGKIGSIDALDFLMLMLLDPNKNIREETALALENLLNFDLCQYKLKEFFEEDEERKETFKNLYKMLQFQIKFNSTFS